MKRPLVLTMLTVVTLTMASFSVAAGRVPGEKLDSGLGELPQGYTAAEFYSPGEVRILGESLDSGLGDLSPTYTAAEYNLAAQINLLGEKLDSGLGALSLQDVMKYVLTHSGNETAALR